VNLAFASLPPDLRRAPKEIIDFLDHKTGCVKDKATPTSQTGHSEGPEPFR